MYVGSFGTKWRYKWVCRWSVSNPWYKQRRLEPTLLDYAISCNLYHSRDMRVHSFLCDVMRKCLERKSRSRLIKRMSYTTLQHLIQRETLIILFFTNKLESPDFLEVSDFKLYFIVSLWDPHFKNILFQIISALSTYHSAIGQKI